MGRQYGESEAKAMFDIPIFQGSVEEFIARKEDFAGKQVSVFDAPEEEEEIDWDSLPPPPDTITICDRAHEEELMLSALQSPLEPLPDNEAELIMEEVKKRLAARDAAK